MGRRILLADDSITIQKVVNLTFSDEEIEVITVGNGELAINKLESVNPDLVLADIFMPGKNGYEVCEYIKNHTRFKNIPVLLLVGAFEPFDKNEAIRVKADGHLTKPFESRALVTTVKQLLEHSSPRTSGSGYPAISTPSIGYMQSQLDSKEEVDLNKTQVLASDLSVFTPISPSLPSLYDNVLIPQPIPSMSNLDDGNQPDLDALAPVEKIPVENSFSDFAPIFSLDRAEIGYPEPKTENNFNSITSTIPVDDLPVSSYDTIDFHSVLEIDDYVAESVSKNADLFEPGPDPLFDTFANASEETASVQSEIDSSIEPMTLLGVDTDVAIVSTTILTSDPLLEDIFNSSIDTQEDAPILSESSSWLSAPESIELPAENAEQVIEDISSYDDNDITSKVVDIPKQALIFELPEEQFSNETNTNFDFLPSGLVEAEKTLQNEEKELENAPSFFDKTNFLIDENEESSSEQALSTPVESPVSNFQISEDIINQIVERVVKQLSDTVVREVAWEVVPDLAELMIEKCLAEGIKQTNIVD